MQVLDNTVHKQNLNYIKISAKLLLKGMKFAGKKNKKKTIIIRLVLLPAYVFVAIVVKGVIVSGSLL